MTVLGKSMLPCAKISVAAPCKCRFTEKLTIIVFKGKRFTVDLTAEGMGTTIVCNPPIKDGVDLGTHFACQTCRKRFTFTNRGRRTQVYRQAYVC